MRLVAEREPVHARECVELSAEGDNTKLNAAGGLFHSETVTAVASRPSAPQENSNGTITDFRVRCFAETKKEGSSAILTIQRPTFLRSFVFE